MADRLTLRVITPDRIVLDTSVESVRLPGVDGSMGVLPRHAPMVAALDVGVMLTRIDGAEQPVFVSGGFAEVRDNTVRVVTGAGERAERIDPERAERAAERARERIAQSSMPDVDLARAEFALRKALMRLSARSHGR